jgi:hypothetical protein
MAFFDLSHFGLPLDTRDEGRKAAKAGQYIVSPTSGAQLGLCTNDLDVVEGGLVKTVTDPTLLRYRRCQRRFRHAQTVVMWSVCCAVRARALAEATRWRVAFRSVSKHNAGCVLPADLFLRRRRGQSAASRKKGACTST